jgi:hypothetical protein
MSQTSTIVHSISSSKTSAAAPAKPAKNLALPLAVLLSLAVIGSPKSPAACLAPTAAPTTLAPKISLYKPTAAPTSDRAPTAAPTRGQAHGGADRGAQAHRRADGRAHHGAQAHGGADLGAQADGRADDAGAVIGSTRRRVARLSRLAKDPTPSAWTEFPRYI